MTSTPFAFSSLDFSTKPGRCFCEHVGVNAPGTAKRTTFFPDVRSETERVLSSSDESKKESVELGNLSPTEIVAKILGKVVVVCA